MPAANKTGEAIVLTYAACVVLVLLLVIAFRWRYRWLARRAAHRRADGSRGFLARQALPILVKMADDHSTPAVIHRIQHWLGGSYSNEAGWQRWLANPTDRGWASLNTQLDRPRGGRPAWRSSAPSPESLQRLFAEAVAPSRDARARGRLGEFCAGHGLAPQAPAERATFFLLTGQLEQYRAEDPDGSLVAATYQAAAEATRAAVRETALAAGDMNLLHALARRPQLAGELTSEQAGRLARELAGRGECPALWRLALDATLEQALAVAPLLHGWQPPAETRRRLLELLQNADPGLVAAARATLRAAPATGLPALPLVTSVSFAPDLSQVAVASHTGNYDPVRFLGQRLEAAIEVFALPGGQRVSRIASDRWLTRSVLHLGDVVVAADVRRYARGELRPSACRLISYRGRSRKLLWRTWVFARESRRVPLLQAAWSLWDSRGWQLAPTRSGSGFATARPLGGGLLLGSGRRRALTRTGARLGGVMQRSDRVLLGTDPASGRIALTSGTDLVVLDSTLRVLASHHAAIRRFRGAAPFFCGPDTLVTAGPGELELWHLKGGDSGAGTLEPVTLQTLDHGAYWPPLAVLPAAGLVACHGSGGRVSWFDTVALNPAAAPPGMPDEPVDGLWASPGGEYLAVAVGGRVRVCEPSPGAAAALLTRPMGAMGPADLEAATELERTEPNPAVRHAVGLLRACLEHRIGGEVALSDAAALGAAGADDIGLAPEGA